MSKMIIIFMSLLVIFTACNKKPEQAIMEIEINKVEKAFKIKKDKEKAEAMLLEALDSFNPFCKSLGKESFSITDKFKKEVNKKGFGFVMVLGAVNDLQKKIKKGEIKKLEEKELKGLREICEALKQME